MGEAYTHGNPFIVNVRSLQEYQTDVRYRLQYQAVYGAIKWCEPSDTPSCAIIHIRLSEGGTGCRLIRKCQGAVAQIH